MPWGVVAGAVIAGGASIAASNKAAGAAEKGANAATAETRRQFDVTQQNMAPWLQAGGDALKLQNQYLAGDTSGFENSPDYKFAVAQGFKGLNRMEAANSAYGSGGADADRIALGQGLATQYANNYWAKLSGLSGTGQSTAQQLGTFGANAAQSIGNNYATAANARGSAYTNAGNQIGDIAQTGANVYRYKYGT
jgi:hypothetical protein